MINEFTPFNGATLYNGNYLQYTSIPKLLITDAIEDKLPQNSNWIKVKHKRFPPNLLQRENPYRIEQTPKKEVLYFNQVTRKYFAVTDLDVKIYQRSVVLQKFSDTYLPHTAEDGNLTIYSVVADIADYPILTRLLDTIKVRLGRHKLPLKGYFALRDYDYMGIVKKVGKKPHYHFLFCINRSDSKRFKKLFKKYKVRIKKMDGTGMAGYLKKRVFMLAIARGAF
jgi:hypothetical protein